MFFFDVSNNAKFNRTFKNKFYQPFKEVSKKHIHLMRLR